MTFISRIYDSQDIREFLNLGASARAVCNSIIIISSPEPKAHR